MKEPLPEPSWPKTWARAYEFDLQEVYQSKSVSGYALAYSSRRTATLEMVRRYLPPGAKILDVAAAQGNFSIALAEMGYDVTWNDLRSDLVGYVKLKHDSANLDYVTGDVFELEFDANFDAVLITEVIEHVAHPDQFLEKISRMVGPGGYIFMTTPNGAYIRNSLPRFSDCKDPSAFESVQFKPDSDGHIFLLWPDEIVSLGERTKLEVLEHRFITWPLTNGHLKTAALLQVLPRGIVLGLERLVRKMPRFILKRIMIQSAVCYRRKLLAA